MKNYNNTVAKLIVSILAVFAVIGVNADMVYADSDCDKNYGGGETCLVNKRFKIEKSVRLEGDDDWEDEVTIDLTDKDESEKYIEFRIKIKNLSDDEGDIDFDDMKMHDKLPDELERIGGSGLTEYWDDFEPGETKEFKIRVEIDEDELDRDGEYEKCAVNKAEVYWDDEFEGADTATVCWKNYDKDIKELPKTGAESLLLALGGLVLASAGAVLKKKQ